ncbi:transposase [Streptomyces lavendulae]|uniref:transposase n=1 Tax=Streptomyces lavendulae TaxID=1914 RepID=UPI003F4D5C3C
MSLPVEGSGREALDVLSRFRVEFYESLYARADVLFELTDSVLCADGPVNTLVELSLTAEHRRGHGALYSALDRGWIEPTRLRRALAELPLPKAADGRIVLAVDVSNWLRPDAPTSDNRLFCHVYGRGGRNTDQLIPGWPYSFVAALEPGRTSWCRLLDSVRLGPADDATLVTAAQLREVVKRLVIAGHWKPGDPEILIVMDSGDDIAYLSHSLQDLPVVLLGRPRSDRVMLRDPGPARSGPKGGRPRRHGGVLRPPAPLGAANRASAPHPRPGEAGVSQRPRDGGPPGSRTETVPTRPWTTSGLEEQTPGQAPRRRQDGQTRRVDQGTPSPQRINAKLRESEQSQERLGSIFVIAVHLGAIRKGACPRSPSTCGSPDTAGALSCDYFDSAMV